MLSMPIMDALQRQNWGWSGGIFVPFVLLKTLKFEGFLFAKDLDKTDQFCDSCSATLPLSECQGFLEMKNFQITTHCSNIKTQLNYFLLYYEAFSFNKYFQSPVQLLVFGNRCLRDSWKGEEGSKRAAGGKSVRSQSGNTENTSQFLRSIVARKDFWYVYFYDNLSTGRG